MLNPQHYITFFLTLLSTLITAQSGQVNIPRIDMMPNQPTPYNVRDWKKTAEKYDSLVFNLNLNGDYLPVTHLVPSGVNYPQRPTFRMHTYVGTNSPFGNEAINVLPTLVGSTLVGIDKSNQFGQNWILMAQDFYNKANGQNIYLNNPGAGSGNDWWYDMMPNVFFYQLYDLYPNMGGDAELQFISVADRMLEAVQQMGSSDTPWEPAFMNYRAWDFKTMEPNASGVPEPEAAGAFAWLLYHAYITTGKESYLKGAEWSIEFLDNWTTNPSYELQLPYGTYVAAKMNADLGTDYDVEKMVNWSFDRGFLRGWGTIVGKWGGFEVSGLVGEANDNGNDYAFQLNGMQQAAALVPMVRYDKRFARSIGKWVLNLANASRFFYHGFLPAQLQDASDWSAVNDPDQVIGYEALREVWQGQSPFSTGDALRGGWAATNLALYGTSSVGYLGAMVEKTNVDQILKIDLLKTDFFREAAYPSYLFYNAHPTSQTIEFAIGNDAADIYDALSETFVLQNVNGTINLTIPADEALLIVVCPTNGTLTYKGNKMLVNGVVVDYDQHAVPYTFAPRFKALAALDNPLETTDTTTIFATISDADSDQFTYQWSATDGQLSGAGSEVTFIASSDAGDTEVQCIVNDPENNKDTAVITISIVPIINQAPSIIEVKKSSPYLSTEENLQLTCLAVDDFSDNLTYDWTSNGGTITGTGNVVDWKAPDTEGIFQITVMVTDENNLSTSLTTSILVKNFTPIPGNIIAEYPFSGNPEDISGNQLHGQSSGAILTVDNLGNQQSAYYFNGGAQHIAVANDPLLNFTEGITVSCWFKANALPDKESFLLSHGSWQNRWKISVTPSRQLRWTLNSTSGISDLDTNTPLNIDSFYHVSATYDGQLLALYLQGELSSYKEFSGDIRTTSFPFLIGQMLPDETDYNFKGVIDEVQINDHALTPDEVKELYRQNIRTSLDALPAEAKLGIQIFPNPASQILTIFMQAPDEEILSVHVYDISGKLVSREEPTRHKSIRLNISNYHKGVYLVQITGKHSIYSDRFIKP